MPKHAMNAETIAKALGGRKAGGGWMARCPSHDDREPSLSIRDADDGKVLVRCHAGCYQGQVIAALRSRGLWEENGYRRFTRPASRATANDRPDRDDAKRSAAALAIWQAATLADGTPVETYLVSRGLHIPPPPTLRFHAGLKHPSGGIWPAMVALVTRGTDDAPLAITRTFLSHDGRRKALVEPSRMMLGRVAGGAVRLAPAGDTLGVAEGIETALSVMQATGMPMWAALSTSGYARLGLPPGVREIVIFADNDRAGLEAARHAAVRWHAEGRTVRIAVPPQPGMDFNDLVGPDSDVEAAA